MGIEWKQPNAAVKARVAMGELSADGSLAELSAHFFIR
jgi:hypothetical protein